MLHLAVDADQRPLAIGNRRAVEQFDEFGHDPLAECRTRFEERSQIGDAAAGEWVRDHRDADRAHNRPRRRGAEFGKGNVAQGDDLADIGHDHPFSPHPAGGGA